MSDSNPSPKLPHVRFSAASLVLYAFLLLAAGVHAQTTYTWGFDVGGNWNTSTATTGWGVAGGGFPSAAGDIVNLTRDITATRNIAVNVPGAVAGVINISDATPSHNWGITSTGGNVLTLDNLDTAAAVINISNGTFTISAPLVLNDNLVTNVERGRSLTLSGAMNANFKTITHAGPGGITLGAAAITDLAGFESRGGFNGNVTFSGANTLSTGDFTITNRGEGNQLTLSGATTVSSGKFIAQTQGIQDIIISAPVTATALEITGLGMQVRSAPVNTNNNNARMGSSNSLRNLVTLNNTTAHTLSTNAVTVANAGLNLNYSAVGTDTKLASTTAVTLSNASLFMMGNTLGNNSQTLASTTLGQGYSVVQAQVALGGTGGPYTTALDLGTLSRSHNAATVDLRATVIGGSNQVNVATVKASHTLTNGMIGAWATYNGTEWASISGGNVVAATYTPLNTAGHTLGTENVTYDPDTAVLNLTGPIVANSLRIVTNVHTGDSTAESTLNLGSHAITLTTGGVLYGGDTVLNTFEVHGSSGVATTFNGTGLLSGADADSDLYVFTNNGRLTILNPLVGTGAGRLIKSGVGDLVVTAAATYTGGTVVHGGTLRADGAALSSGNLTLDSGGIYATSGTFSRSIGTGAGEVQFGPGGGGFSAAGGDLAVRLNGGAGAVTAAQLGGNLALNSHVYSTGVVDFQNSIVMNGDFVVSSGSQGYTAAAARVNVGTASNLGAAFAVLSGDISGTGNLVIHGPGLSGGDLSSIGGSAGMVVARGALTHDGSTVVVGGSLFVRSLSEVPGNLILAASGVLATNGTLDATLGDGAGQLQFLGGTSSFSAGGFAAVGGPLTVSLNGGVQLGTNTNQFGIGLILGNAFASHGVDFQNGINYANTLTVDTYGAALNQVSGQLTGASGITVNVGGTGIVAFTHAANNFAGPVSIARGATFRMANTSSLGTTDSGTSVSGTLDLNGVSLSGEALTVSGDAGPLGLAHVINTSSTPATIAGSTITLISFGSDAFGGAGDITVASNFVASFSGSATLTKRGNGTLRLQGDTSGVVFGGSNAGFNTALRGGTTILDYSSNTGNKLLMGTTGTGTNLLTLQQTVMTLEGHATTAVTQNAAAAAASQNTTIDVGFSRVRLVGAGGNVTLNLNTLASTSSGGVVDFSTTGAGALAITIDNLTAANGILPVWMTWDRSTWAVGGTSGTDNTVAPFTGLTTKNDVSTWGTGALGSVHLTDDTTGYSGTVTGTGNLDYGTLRFNAAADSSVNLGTRTLRLGDASIPGAIMVTGAVGAHDVSISGSSLSTRSSALYIHQHNTAGKLTIASTIAGGGVQLVKTGEGALVLTGTNTFSATTRIHGGSVTINAIANVGVSQPLGTHADVFLQGGATLVYDSGTSQATNKVINVGLGNGTIEVGAGSTLTLDGTSRDFFTAPILTAIKHEATQANLGSTPNLTIGGAGNAVVNGAIVLVTPAEAQAFGNAGGAANVSVMEGYSQVTKTGSGTWRLNATNSWQGGTVIDEGRLELGHATDTISNNAPVTVNTGGTLDVLNNTDRVGEVRLKGGTLDATGGGTLVAMSYAFESGMANASLGGVITSMTKTSGGTVTLAGANTYELGTTVSGGTLLVNNTSGSGTGSGGVTTAAGTTLGGTGTMAPAGTAGVSISGSVDPGDPAANTGVGTLSFTPVKSNVTFTATSTADFQLKTNGSHGLAATFNPDGSLASVTGTSASGGNDRLVFTGGATTNKLDLTSLGAQNINVTFAAGYTPAAGDVFDLLDWSNLSGTDHASAIMGLTTAQLDLPSLTTFDPLWAWDTGLWETQGVVAIVVAVPEPGRALLVLMGAFTLALRRRRVIQKWKSQP
ncbi:MAG: beta strand repeat-containing protein [Prosthecobacter sp.]